MECKSLVIIGSLTSSAKDIADCVNLCKEIGTYYKIIYPISNQNEHDTLKNIQKRYIKYIWQADDIILVRKPDKTIGESTTYELALSEFLNKGILEYDPVQGILIPYEY